MEFHWQRTMWLWRNPDNVTHRQHAVLTMWHRQHMLTMSHIVNTACWRCVTLSHINVIFWFSKVKIFWLLKKSKDWLTFSPSNNETLQVWPNDQIWPNWPNLVHWPNLMAVYCAYMKQMTLPSDNIWLLAHDNNTNNWFIVTMGISRTVFEINSDFCRKSQILTISCFACISNADVQQKWVSTSDCQ